MASTKDIIQINITRETQGVTRQGFGTPFFLGLHAAFPERVRTYTSIEGAEELGTDSVAYAAVSAFFSQEISPEFVKVGRQKVDDVDFTVAVANNATYTLTVDGVEVSYTSDADATATEISGGLAAEFASASAPGTFTDNDGSFSILPADADDFSVTFTSNINATYNTTETLTDAVAACRAEDNDWYFLTAYTHDTSDILELAAYAEARTLIYGTSYSGSDALSATDTTDAGSQLQALNYDRTFIIYTSNTSQFPECAIIGLQAPKDPGTTTWKFKQVSGVTATNLSTTQSIILKGTKYDYGKGYNTFEPTGGVDIFAEGRVVSSEFLDVIRGVDWLEARMREEIYLTLINSEKIPYTDAGFTIIEGRMRSVLNRAVVRGFLSDFTINVPDPRSIDTNSRINRVASGFTFNGTLASAVHFVEVNGTVSV